MKRVFVVLGQPRSGTSTIAKALSMLGVSLGENLQQADERNPRGFYEDLNVMYTINRGVSRVWKYEWMDPKLDVSVIDHDAELRSFKNYAAGMLCEQFAKHESWGFKDPRTTMLMPFWKAVFKTVNADDSYIIAVRHPLAVAHSLHKFANIDIESALIAWVKFFVTAIESSHGKKRVLVNYESVLQNPRKQLERMHCQLEIEQPLHEENINHYVESFLDTNLQHHVYTDEDLLMSPVVSVAPICISLYAFAMSLAKDEITFGSDKFKNTWLSLKNELAMVQPALDYLLSLRKRNKELERELRTIKKSWPWKMVTPLRVIDEKLRARRRSNRRKLEV